MEKIIQFCKGLKSYARQIKVSNFVATVITPALLAVVCTFYADLNKVNEWLFFLVFIVVVVVHIFCGLNQFWAKLDIELVDDLCQLRKMNRELGARCKGAEDSNNRCSAHIVLSQAWPQIIAAHVTSSERNTVSWNNCLDALLVPIAEQVNNLFEVTTEEKWSIMVYLHSKKRTGVYVV